MADSESPERLPLGWTEKFDSRDGEQVKFYYNAITGMKFDSKDDLLHYVELGPPSHGTRQQTRALKEGNQEKRLMLMSAETTKAPEWLPQGWIVELNATSSGQKYKRYIDPSTGRKFHSKPEILKYLTSDECNLSTEQIAMSIEYINNPRVGESGGAENLLNAEGSRTRNEFEIVRCEAKGLPPGWIKEIRIEKTGNKLRKDPYFTDPDSKYVFRSCLDALRYLETKDLNVCVMKPRKREVLKFLSDDSSPRVGESSGAETPLKAEGSLTRKKFEIVRCEAKGLPPGWIKEIKIEKSGDKIRKDPYFTDPDSKYVFRSCLDALRYLETKDLKVCVMKPRKREVLKFLSDDTSIPEEKQSLDNAIEECAEKEANHAPTTGEPPRTPVSKRKRGKPVAAPSTDNIMQQEKPTEVIIDPTKYEGKKVISEGIARDYDVRTEERGEGNNLGPQPFERLGGETSLDPCLDFAFKTLRGDIPVEASNLAAQSYNHHQRASVNVGFPSFSDYARR